MNIFISWLLRVQLFGPISTTNSLQNNLYLDTSYIQTGQGYFYGMKIFVGDSLQAHSMVDYFAINFGVAETVFGDSEISAWGVECGEFPEEPSSTCDILSNDVKEAFYHWMLYRYKNARLYVRMSREEILETSGRHKLGIRVISGGQKWPTVSIGLLGLSPRGAFSDYLRQMYDQEMSLLFKFPSYKSDSNDHLLFETQVVQNPTVIDDNIAATIILKPNLHFWAFESALESPIKSQSIKDARVCLTSVADYILLLNDAQVFCDDILRKVCGSKNPRECRMEDLALDDVNDVKLTIKDQILVFSASEYLYTNPKGLARCRFGELSDVASLQFCPQDTNVGLGRLFYYKYAPMLTFGKDHASTITFITQHNAKSDKISFQVKIWASCIALVIIVLQWFLCCKKPTERHEIQELYVNADI